MMTYTFSYYIKIINYNLWNKLVYAINQLQEYSLINKESANKKYT